MRIIFLILLTSFSLHSSGQHATPTLNEDTIPLMTEVVVKGFESQRRLLETPVSAAVVGRNDINRYSPASLTSAINAVPGIRMEERSPGSYRLSIRGSLLRSPFGVRNIKVYWNDIPFTDAGGNTYFNLADQSSIGQIEVLRGPGASLYGANTGGVIILHPDELPLATENGSKENRFRAQISGGSYGLAGENMQWKFRNKNISSTITQSHLQSDGYRENTRLRRDVLQWNGSAYLSEKDKLDWILMYSDIFYQTPGGLNLQQMMANPRMARPDAIERKAAIYNKTPLVGISNQYQLNKNWSNITSIMFSYSDFTNPFITNYETRKETNLGLRTKLVYHALTGKNDLKFTGGMEWLRNFADINNFGNIKGKPDTVQFKDKMWARQVSPFLQGEWQWGTSFQLQAGLSSNLFVYRYQRLTDPDPSKKGKNLENQIMPRIAALYRLTDRISIYSSLSKGFSPPSIAEVRPSEGSFYTDLQPEYGWNREIGIRGHAFHGRLQFDITAYQFKLRDAIVKRVDSLGGDYFVNAGGTNQKGIELFAGYIPVHNNMNFFQNIRLWTSVTISNYSFTEYKVGDKNYSGNRLTGVAKTIWIGGLDISSRIGLFLNTSLTHTSGLPLNDANSVYSSAYDLLLGKFGWEKQFSGFSLEVFAGVDNALNQLYSLGNDINAAFGSRYYNPAPGRNYYGGLAITF